MIDLLSEFNDYPHCQEAHKYLIDVVGGRIPAGLYVKKACLRQLNDLYNSDLPFCFDPALAEKPILFMEDLHHVKGEWAKRKKRISLEPWQKFIIAASHGWVDTSGSRRFLEVYLEVPRKNGKTVIGAGLGVFHLCADGEFAAEVYCGASSEKQAHETFGPAKAMVKRDPDLREAFGISVFKSSISIPENGSRMEPLTGKPGDGASPSVAVVDEFHEHRTPDLYDTMSTGMGARKQPLIFITTTAGFNLASPCYQKHQDVKQLLEGLISNERLFGIIYGLDDEDDWTSENSLRKANPNLDVSVSRDYLLHRQHEAQISVSQQNKFKTKHLNIWCGAPSSWMNMEKWRKQPKRKTLEELSGRRCFVSIDMASKIDIAAMLAVFPPVKDEPGFDDDPFFHVHGWYYLPEEVVLSAESGNASHYESWAKQGFLTLTDGDVTDQRTITDDLKELNSQFDLVEVPFDPREMAFMAAEMLEEGINMIEFPQTTARMSEPMKQTEMLAYQGQLAHGNCPVLAWMISNVVVKTRNKMVHPAKERGDNKIDGAVSLIMGIARWMFYQAEEENNPYNVTDLISV